MSRQGLGSLTNLVNRARSEGPLLVLGAKGQVGRALVQASKDCGVEVVGLSRQDLDLSDFQQVIRQLREIQPSLVLNAAAYTAVDLAETEVEAAQILNARLPGLLAEQCGQHQVPFVHYSTDYVFSGEGDRPWREDDPTGPVNVYGQTKLKGELAVQAACREHLTFRTSWVFDEQGKNFLTTMLRLGQERERLTVVSDQVGAPSFAKDLAELSLQALNRALDRNQASSQGQPMLWGLYHLCSQGQTTWYEFAQAIFAEAKARGLPLKVQSVEAILTQDYPTAAKRPLNSRLDLGKFISHFELSPPHWSQALGACMESLFAHGKELQ